VVPALGTGESRVQVAVHSQQLSNAAVVTVMVVLLVPMDLLMRRAEGSNIASNDFDMLHEYSLSAPDA
jgi:hypothetical protein